jgi:protein-tyrosine phosphatase
MRRVVRDRGLDDRIQIDSAGTHAYHVGEPPDPRSQQTALDHGVDLSAQRARQAEREDFERFDYVIAMDEQNHRQLTRLASGNGRARLALLCDFAPKAGTRSVPDPYYGGDSGFEDVYHLVQAGAEGLLDAIVQEHFPDHAAGT